MLLNKFVAVRAAWPPCSNLVGDSNPLTGASTKVSGKTICMFGKKRPTNPGNNPDPSSCEFIQCR